MKPKFKQGEIINDLEILSYAKSRTSPSGAIKKYYNVKCKKCGNEKEMNTQTIQNAKSCGCVGNKGKPKPLNSGKKSPIGTIVQINTLISIYNSNAKKRGIDFNLSYTDFASLIKSDCFFCNEKPSNLLKKKGYEDFPYNGIDRIDNNIGYVLDNCVSCCSWCNQAKNDKEFYFFIKKCMSISKNFEQEEKYYNIAHKRIFGESAPQIVI